MQFCNKLLGRGAVQWPCLLSPDHDGPHMAQEFAPSVAQRKAWESAHGDSSRQLPLWEDDSRVQIEEPVVQVDPDHPSLDELQGTPQTFWQRHGGGDEFPAPGVVESREGPVEIVVDRAQDDVVPMLRTEAAAFMAQTSSALLDEASRAFFAGDEGRGNELMSLARANMEALDRFADTGLA